MNFLFLFDANKSLTVLKLLSFKGFIKFWISNLEKILKIMMHYSIADFY